MIVRAEVRARVVDDHSVAEVELWDDRGHATCHTVTVKAAWELVAGLLSFVRLAATGRRNNMAAEVDHD